MMKNISRFVKRSAAGLCALLALCMTMCIDEDMSNCFYARILVVPDVTQGEDAVSPEDIGRITLYVYDAATGELVCTAPAGINEHKTLLLPHEGDYRLVAVANQDGGTTTEGAQAGQPIDGAFVSLRQAAMFDGMRIYGFPEDLCWGAADFTFRASDGDRAVEVPLRRVVAGVYIRIGGLKEHIGGEGVAAGDFSVVLGALYNKVGFDGRPSFATRAATDPVNYMASGEFVSIGGEEYYTIPAKSDAPSGFLNVIASDEGVPVSVSIYHKGNLLLPPITTGQINNTSGPLTLINGKTHTLEITLGPSSAVTVAMTAGKWGQIKVPDKEF